MNDLKKCCVCNKTEKEVALIHATLDNNTDDYCTSCIQLQDDDKRMSAFSYEIDLGFGTGAPTTETTFYFKVMPEYFGNADKIKATYSHEKPINEKSFESHTRLNLVAQVMMITIVDSDTTPVITLLEDKDELVWEIYNSIIPISKEEYDVL